MLVGILYIALGFSLLLQACQTTPSVKSEEGKNKFLVAGKLIRKNSARAGHYPFEIRKVSGADLAAMDSTGARLSESSEIVETGTSSEEGYFQLYLAPGAYCMSFPRLTEVRCDQALRVAGGPIRGLVFRVPF